MREYMLNKYPVSPYNQVCEVFKRELGMTSDKIFSEFNPDPIASASLAQVHVAHTHDAQKVAAKVQHTHMSDTAAADHAGVALIVITLYRFFPSVDYRWLVDEVSESLPKSLFWNLSTSKLLTMEFMDGAQINDVKAIQKLGVQPSEVAKLENSKKLGAGKDLYALIAGILTMKPWNRVIDPTVDHLVIQGTDNERSELQMYASEYFP
ncbi:putative ABC1 protein At2g40090 [Benincasa hispida]|uniref:putative ABC1 protein At2g40090 n=1 Tax=Benincasa hispida TaxID=102211 RepID=UPI0019029A34|nr:putative ABC1 protein At2g40090 [Benincasa hispida]